MASKNDMETAQSVDNQTATLNKCISIFKSSKSDNERFAALLLVTRLVQSDNIDSAQRRLLYDAIGFTFINRLLKTNNSPENSLYQSLAIAILACFATDQELLLNPQMVSKIDVLNRLISNSANDQSVIDDAFQILSHYSSCAEGCRILIQKNTISYLCEVILSESDRSFQAWQVILNIASQNETNMWNAYPKPLIQLITYSAKQLRTLQDSNKFTYCSKLQSLLSKTDAEAFRRALKCSDDASQLLTDLASGLGDILQGKVTSSQRDPAILLVSIMVNLLDDDTKKTFLTNQSTDANRADFFSLVTTTVCIEVRMLLDESTMEQLINKANLLTSCYIILEDIIGHLITVSNIDNNTQGAQTTFTKLYTQITEVMMSVLAFLQQESIKYEEELMSCQQEFDIVLASSRVLLAWLAEESMAFQKDVNKIVPFMIQIARDTLPGNMDEYGTDSVAHLTALLFKGRYYEQETQQPFTNHSDIEMIRFMLPALCHLSSEEKSRQILIENSVPELLLKYYHLLWKSCDEGNATATDSKTAVITLLGVFLNFAVTEEMLVTNDPTFKELLQFVLVNISKITNSVENIEVLANLAVLGLMLLRFQKDVITIEPDKVASFFKSVLLFLKEADKLRKSQDDKCRLLWSSVSELWFLGCQVIVQEFGDRSGHVTKTIPDNVFQELVKVSSQGNQ